MTVTALRSLLRFLHLEGAIGSPLADVVPSVASSRLGGLPRGLDPTEVERLLAACDRSAARGRRDYAIVKLAARLRPPGRRDRGAQLGRRRLAGRRARRSRQGRAERLPLPADVGEALTDYLREGRPRAAHGREVFVRARAPRRALTRTGVTQAVLAAARRAGLGTVHAHRLRHTAATEVLRAGASLTEVGQLLRHRRVQTTAIYAKVDREALRTIARPWGGG